MYIQTSSFCREIILLRTDLKLLFFRLDILLGVQNKF